MTANFFDRISPHRTREKIRELSVSDLLATGPDIGGSSLALKSLVVTGLLSFADESSFEFGRLNILVGPNGSGKSNLIDCLRLLSNAPHDIQDTFKETGFEEWANKRQSGDTAAAYLHLTCSLPDELGELHQQLILGPPQKSRAPIEETIFRPEKSEQITEFFVGSYRSSAMIRRSGSSRRSPMREMGLNEYDPFRSILGQVRDVVQYPELTRLADFLAGFRIYSEWSFGRSSRLREATPAGRSSVYLSENMDDLALVLNGMERTVAHEQIRLLLKDLKETYIDFITRVIFGRVGLEIQEAPFDTAIPASRLSDGTLRFLALAAILLQSNPPSLISIEEPELGMHPDMIRMVANMLVECSRKTQIIVSTHSEHLLSALQADFDVLFAFDAGVNGSVVRRFDKAGLSDWLEDHSLGELWSSGELGGNRW